MSTPHARAFGQAKGNGKKILSHAASNQAGKSNSGRPAMSNRGPSRARARARNARASAATATTASASTPGNTTTAVEANAR
jgi:hypothetical protein